MVSSPGLGFKVWGLGITAVRCWLDIFKLVRGITFRGP